MKIDYVRGARDYIRAADMIVDSPLPRDATQFQFFFRHLARHPGQWQISAQGAEAAATLTVQAPEGRQNWIFSVDVSAAMSRRLDDIDERSILENVRVEGGKLSCNLVGTFTFWDQIVAATRLGGEQLFPSTKWYLIYIQGNQHALRGSYNGLALELRLGRQKGQVLELNYNLDGVSAGRLGLFPR